MRMPFATTYSANQLVDAIVAAQTVDPDRLIRIGRAAEYPKQVWYFIASFVALVSLCHFLSVISTYTRTVKPASKGIAPRGRISLLQLPRALVELFRIVAFRCTIPIGQSHSLNVAEVFLTAAYMAVVLTWSLINSTATTGLKLDPKYWANTAGNIAASQLSLLVALGMKNNIFSLLTGISFDKLNYLHRMVARVLCVLIWVHAGGRMKLGLAGAVTWNHPWVQCGLLAGVSLTLLSLVSIRPIRDAGYEVFKVVHLALACIFILSAYFHSNGLGLGYYVWPSILLWGLDRFLRALRLLVFTSKATLNGNATVDVLSSHFLRLKVVKPKFLRWAPGQSVYLTIPGVSLIQAHPFTISGVETVDSEEKLVFLIRVRNGITRRLLHKAQDSYKAAVFLDGPYSSPPLLRGHETVILIAGGSGVAFTLPLLLDVLRQCKAGKPPCSRVLFVWAIRDANHISWISELLHGALDGVSNIEVDIYIYITEGTQEAEGEWDDNLVNMDPEDKAEELPTSSQAGISDPNISRFVTISQRQRPDLTGIIDRELNVCSGGTVSINGSYLPRLILDQC
ncbi:FAD-binding domain-containing protein [Armillaria luteobubalina]|uniref:ferric-chelate reductase (NADPH) n=1 Tax=Armillaria luteobubalina TaxID=153913 RepID=A0AA39PS48_9AGAR|nr:FAD-binding domain-containing protein [Armillaria luteobubalina]